MKKLEHLSEIANNYDTYIIDLWGVIHNGIKLNEDAILTIEKLHNMKKKVVFLSNAPRPSKNVINFLKKLNMNEKYLKNVFTSGEASSIAIKSEKFGKYFYHLGPQRDNSLFKGLEQNKKNLSDCDYILCTGLYDEYMNDLNFYSKLLINFKDKIMVCTNPDLIVDRGNETEFCAGKIAQIFENLGGKVVYFGKPHFSIYNLILKKSDKALMIGDNLQTDIKGANSEKIDTNTVLSPCGSCRQSMYEYESKQNAPIKVLLKGVDNEVVEFLSVADLLPLVFQCDGLKKVR